MPLSSNAPFSEFGNSMILRDIEQLWLALGGAGSGSSGEGQTQDQSAGVTQETGDSGGLPDLSGLATKLYVDTAIASVPQIIHWYYYGTSGSVSLGSGYTDCSFTTSSGNLASYVSGKTFTAPSNGTYTITLRHITGDLTKSGAVGTGSYNVFAELTPAYGNGRGLGVFAWPTLAGGESLTAKVQAQAIWTGYMAAGETCDFQVYSEIAPSTNSFYFAHISGITY